jgi:surfactin synthase thioesterase subunit
MLCGMLQVPLERDDDECEALAKLWRASIVPAMVHVGAASTHATMSHTMPPFPLPAATADAATVHEYASGAPSLSACPLVALGSTADKIWPWNLPARWADVAAAGFRLASVDGVAHFKLMASEPVVALVLRELCGAAIAHVRFG